MLYEQFIKEIEARVRVLAGEDKKISIYTAVKNNGRERKGITFREEGAGISPTIYLEEYYEKFKNGYTLEAVAEQIIQLYRRVIPRCTWEDDFVKRYENVKDRIIYQLVNREANSEMLRRTPYVPCLDLAIIFYVLVEIEREYGRTARMLVQKAHLERWEVTEKEIYQRAHHNTEKIFPYEFLNMRALLGEGTEELEDDEDALFVMTNRARNFGAASILYPGRLEAVGMYLGENYYLLPSSIHEVIILPEGRNPGVSFLKKIVWEINHSQVQEDEILSDNVYYYNRENNRLSVNGRES